MKPSGLNVTNRSPVLLRYLIILFWAMGIVTSGAEKVLNVGIYDNPPKIFIDKEGRPSGIFVDLLNRIASVEDWQINYKFYTWKECLQQLENGNIDLMPDMAYSLERKKQFEFNEVAVLESWSQVYVNNNKQIQQLSDLNGKRIALLNGSVQQNNFRQMMKGFDYQYTEILANSLHETLSLVRIDIADAAITNHFFGDLNAPNYELQKTPIILNPENLFFAVRPSSDTSIINTIDLYLKVWRNTPQSFYYITLQQYTHSEPPTPFINPVKIILFLLAVSIIILLVAVLYSKQRTIRKLLKQMTDNKRLIQHEEDKFRSYFESSPIGLFVADTQGRYIDVNPSACQITGYKAQELKSLTIADLIPESGRKAAGNHFNQLKTEGRAKASMPFQTRSGEIRHWTVNAVKIEEDKLIGFVEDITERMKMDKERSQLPKALEKKVKEKTQELSLRISELEHFREVTIERELRMEELRTEIKRLKKK